MEVDGGVDGNGPCVEVKQGGSCQGKQGDDGWGWERGEQQLEEKVHGAWSARAQRNVDGLQFKDQFQSSDRTPYLKMYTVKSHCAIPCIPTLLFMSAQ